MAVVVQFPVCRLELSDTLKRNQRHGNGSDQRGLDRRPGSKDGYLVKTVERVGMKLDAESAWKKVERMSRSLAVLMLLAILGSGMVWAQSTGSSRRLAT